MAKVLGETMSVHPELHRWENHPANIACRALSDARFIKCSRLLLEETGCGDGGALIRFRSDQDPDEVPLIGCEIILFDEEYIVPLFDLYSALYLETVARKERNACDGLPPLIAQIRARVSNLADNKQRGRAC